MPNVLRNVLAILAGLVLGSGVNMALIALGPSLVPPPAGVNVRDAESLRAGMHLFGPSISSCRSWRMRSGPSSARSSRG